MEVIVFNGVDSSSGLNPPRKSSSSSKSDELSACIIWSRLGCLDLRLKLLMTEPSKPGVLPMRELKSPLRPTKDNVDEYPRALVIVAGRLPVSERPSGDEAMTLLSFELFCVGVLTVRTGSCRFMEEECCGVVARVCLERPSVTDSARVSLFSVGLSAFFSVDAAGGARCTARFLRAGGRGIMRGRPLCYVWLN